MYSSNTALPSVSADSSILLAPMTRSAFLTASDAACVYVWLLTPIPMSDTFLLGMGIERRFDNKSNTSSNSEPSTSLGLAMSTTSIPNSLAASYFSSKPPMLPESLVTRYFAPDCMNMALLISLENGPCAHIRFLPSKPSSKHWSMDCFTERILRTTLSLKSGMRVYSAASLEPVVPNIFPSLSER